MTRDDFIDHWQEWMAGAALFGLVMDTDKRCSGQMSAAAAALEIRDKVRKRLGQMYDTVCPPEPAMVAPSPFAVDPAVAKIVERIDGATSLVDLQTRWKAMNGELADAMKRPESKATIEAAKARVKTRFESQA